MKLSEIQFGIIVSYCPCGKDQTVGMVKGVRYLPNGDVTVVVEWANGSESWIHPANLERYED